MAAKHSTKLSPAPLTRGGEGGWGNSDRPPPFGQNITIAPLLDRAGEAIGAARASNGRGGSEIASYTFHLNSRICIAFAIGGVPGRVGRPQVRAHATYPLPLQNMRYTSTCTSAWGIVEPGRRETGLMGVTGGDCIEYPPPLEPCLASSPSTPQTLFPCVLLPHTHNIVHTILSHLLRPSARGFLSPSLHSLLRLISRL